MVYLSTLGPGILASRQEIAEHAGIPSHFLAKIAQDLARAGFIEIRQGAKGGFILLRNPETISLLDIVETIIGEIYLNDCVARPSSCTSTACCAVHRVWMDARDQLRNTLAGVSFAQLVLQGSCIPGLSAEKGTAHVAYENIPELESEPRVKCDQGTT